MKTSADPIRDAAPELLEMLKLAVARIKLANEEGDPILSAWLPGAQATISKADGHAHAPMPSLQGGAERTLDALRRAERFICGFEDDPLQDGIDVDLDAIRTAIAELEVSATFGREQQ